MAQNGSAQMQKFLDENQYTKNGILRYEKIFGVGFVSTGGIDTTKVGYVYAVAISYKISIFCNKNHGGMSVQKATFCWFSRLHVCNSWMPGGPTDMHSTDGVYVGCA